MAAYSVLNVFLRCAVIGVSGALALRAAAEVPDASLNLKLAAPIATWDEALPLGNGLLGGLLWGDGSTLRLSLDRGDLWDERPAPGNPLAGFTYAALAKLVAEKKNDAITQLVDRQTYDHPHPTKIPAGRIELDLAENHRVAGFELDLASATGLVRLEHAGRSETVHSFFGAREPVGFMRLPRTAFKTLRVLAPESVKTLGYPAARTGSTADGAEQWFTQETADGQVYGVLVTRREQGGDVLIATTVAFSARDGADVLAAARARIARAFARSYDTEYADHREWWRRFWAKSAVNVPDADVMRHYYLVQYFYGAASRTGAPPIPLQGVWTADAGTLPPWKGDYHHDLNTQMTYMGYQAAGRFEAGRVFLDYMHGLLPAFRRYSRDFFGAPGAAVPAVMSLAGAPLGGWAQYSLSPVHGAWVGHLYYLHWRATADAAFLRERAYPWCREVGTALRALLQANPDGVLVLPLSASPEAFNNKERAWLTPNSNYDIMCLRMLFLANAEMAEAVGEHEAGRDWATLAARLGPYHQTAQHVLKLNANEELTFSHRHLATLMAVYPFNLLTIEGPAEDRATLLASVHDVDRLGVVEWCGYSYSWMAALRARINEPESALWHLKAFLHAFVLRNGFHANGDQTKSGFSSFEYRPFTLEGNFLVAAAVHEMLLQSWSARPGSGDWGPVRVFPAMPWRWADASFEDLVAEGGHRVSARRENGGTTSLKIVAGRDGELRLRDNFDGRVPAWSGHARPVRKTGGDFIFQLKRGDVIEAQLPKPAHPPPAPPNAWLDEVPKPPKDAGIRMYPKK